MSVAAFEFRGVEVVACVSGALYVPAARALLVADLHLEKGSGFAGRGTLLPPYDSRATLAALGRVIARFLPRLVVCLGDSFDDAQASTRLRGEDADHLRDLARGGEWVWIAGNHDALPVAVGGACARELRLGQLLLRHAAGALDGMGEISGHFHPKASIATAGRRITARCFVSDGNRLILPSFGAYTGGLDIFDPAFGALLKPAFMVRLLGRGRIHVLPARRLVGGDRTSGRFIGGEAP